jgi:hypothetical protein
MILDDIMRKYGFISTSYSSSIHEQYEGSGKKFNGKAARRAKEFVTKHFFLLTLLSF